MSMHMSTNMLIVALELKMPRLSSTRTDFVIGQTACSPHKNFLPGSNGHSLLIFGLHLGHMHYSESNYVHVYFGEFVCEIELMFRFD